MKVAQVVLAMVLVSISPVMFAVEPGPEVCDAYARDQANRGQHRGLGIGRSAARGAAWGAILGDSRKSARRGAAIGAMAGGIRRSRARQRSYDYAYAQCMTGKVRF